MAGDWFKNLDAFTKIPQAAGDTRMVVYGGAEEPLHSKDHVCPWYTFPLRLGEWLHKYDGLPNRFDATGLEERLCASYESPGPA